MPQQPLPLVQIQVMQNTTHTQNKGRKVRGKYNWNQKKGRQNWEREKKQYQQLQQGHYEQQQQLKENYKPKREKRENSSSKNQNSQQKYAKGSKDHIYVQFARSIDKTTPGYTSQNNELE